MCGRTVSWSPLLALLLVGCSDKGDDSSGEANAGADADADGFAVPDDCDDDDALVHPEAAESCDGLDNDCDGNVDDDPVDGHTYFQDDDGDGYGAGAGVTSCEPVAGSAENGDDCDDAQSEVSPAATEVCDDLDVDEDCDALVDDEDDSVDASSGSILYADSDGDGFGDPAVSTNACAAIAGYVATADDCDDANSAVNPDATEVCDDGVDNNCDPTDCAWSGEMSEGDAYASLGGEIAKYLGYFGQDVTGLDANGDGVGDLAVGSLASYAAVFTGPIVSASADGGAVAKITGDPPPYPDEFGEFLQGIEDQDGDGYDELIVSAKAYPDGAAAGRSYIFLGPISGYDTAESMASATMTGGVPGEPLGFSPASGDVDGDGVADVLLGAPYLDAFRGTAFVFYGPITGGDLLTWRDSDSTWTGVSSDQGVGFDNSANGDIDGDGVNEVVLGVPLADSASGAVRSSTDRSRVTTRLTKPTSVCPARTTARHSPTRRTGGTSTVTGATTWSWQRTISGAEWATSGSSTPTPFPRQEPSTSPRPTRRSRPTGRATISVRSSTPRVTSTPTGSTI